MKSLFAVAAAFSLLAGHAHAQSTLEAVIKARNIALAASQTAAANPADANAMKGARIAVPPFPANRATVMNNAIAVLQAHGATVDLVPALALQLGGCPSRPPAANYPPAGDPAAPLAVPEAGPTARAPGGGPPG